MQTSLSLSPGSTLGKKKTAWVRPALYVLLFDAALLASNWLSPS